MSCPYCNCSLGAKHKADCPVVTKASKQAVLDMEARLRRLELEVVRLKEKIQ